MGGKEGRGGGGNGGDGWLSCLFGKFVGSLFLLPLLEFTESVRMIDERGGGGDGKGIVED